MLQRIRAIYCDGAFRPETPCNLAENSKVELVVQEATVQEVTLRQPSIADPDERRRILRQVTARMQNNPLPSGARRFSRDELHERR